MKTPNIEAAIKVIETFPVEEDFISKNITLWYNEEYGVGDDNSIELSQYWQECKKLVNTITVIKND